MFSGVSFFGGQLCSGPLISTSSLRAYWKLNGNGNDSWATYSMTTFNVDYSNGPYSDFENSANIRIAADGSSTASQIYNSSTSSLTYTQSGFGVPLTISMWVKARSFPGRDGAGWGKLYGLATKYQTDAPGGGFDLRFFNTSTGSPNVQGIEQLEFLCSTGATERAVWGVTSGGGPSGSPTFSLNKWHHIAGVYSGGASGRCHIYFNGVCVATASAVVPSASQPANTSRRLTIGFCDLNASNTRIRFFDGEIDDVAIFWRGLTQSEIQAIANSQCPLIS